MPSSSFDVFSRRVQSLLPRVPSPKNRATLQQYLDHKRADGIKTSTLLNDAYAITDLAQLLDSKSFQDATRDDVAAFANQTTKMRRRGLGLEAVKVELQPSTQATRKQSIRQFYKWLNGGDAYPDQVRKLRARRPQKDQIPTDRLLTAEDIRVLLNAHTDKREKALLSVLYESGLRAGELCALNIASVAFDQYGAVLTLPKNVPGLKTGARRVRLYHNESVPYLTAWYNDHPLKENAKAPLFYGVSRRAPMQRLTPHGLYEFVHRAGTKAGLQKPLHPHLFRHTAATERARQGFTESQLRAFFGWSRSSDMPSTYVHLAGGDYEEMDLERRGLKTKGEKVRSGLAPITCRACKAENLPTAFYCQNCRVPIHPKAEAKLATQQNEFLAQIVREEVQKLLASNLRG